MTKTHVYFYPVIRRHGYVLRTPAVCSLSLILSVLVFFTDEFWSCFHPAYITRTPDSLTGLSKWLSHLSFLCILLLYHPDFIVIEQDCNRAYIYGFNVKKKNAGVGLWDTEWILVSTDQHRYRLQRERDLGEGGWACELQQQWRFASWALTWDFRWAGGGPGFSWAPVESGHGGERQVVPRIPEEYQLKVEIVGTLTFTSENRQWASGRTLADKPCDGVGGSNTQR